MSVGDRVSSALRNGAADDIFAVRTEIASLPNDVVVDLVVANSWGELIAGRLPDAAVFSLLLALTDARPPPPLRSSFYEQFETAGLCEACAGALSGCHARPEDVTIHRCIRNLARSPSLRGRLAGSLPSLVSTLRTDGAEPVAPNLNLVAASAAALCNLCCDNAFKAEAVRLGAVPSLLQSLKRGPPHTAAEDMVACLGVLIAGFTPGLSELFACGEAPVLLGCLYCRVHPPLQILAADVLSDAASSSSMFTSWLVTETDFVAEHLGDLLDAGVDAKLVDATLGLCKRLVTVDAFARKIQGSKALRAMQSLAQSEPTEMLSGFGTLGDDRRGVSRRDLAMSILSSVFHF